MPDRIAHTYMAADALAAAAKRAGVIFTVETQGSSGSTPLAVKTIADADAVIFATDVGVKDRQRFSGKPVVASGVKRAINEPDRMIAEALSAAAGPPDPVDRRQLHNPVRRRGRPADRAGLPARRLRDRQHAKASLRIMAAVMAAGMVPPLAMALAATLRPGLFTEPERENSRAAWLLGASFISEGAIPFAAADPLRVIPSMMVGGAVTGAVAVISAKQFIGAKPQQPEAEPALAAA